MSWISRSLLFLVVLETFLLFSSGARTALKDAVAGATHPSSHVDIDIDTDAYFRKNGLSVPKSTAAARGPLRVSRVNPRYFADDRGEIVFLAGSHNWASLQDGSYDDPPAKFNYSKYLDFLQAHHHNFFRLWVSEQAEWISEDKRPFFNDPLPYQRTGPGIALDQKPEFDLSKFNQAYFDRMRERVSEAGRRGIYVSIMLFNGFSIGPKPKDVSKNSNPWHGHPFNVRNNINGVDGDLNADDRGDEVQQLLSPRITSLEEAYVRKVIDTVNDLDNVLFEISNESDASSVPWQYHMIDFIHATESALPKQHPVGMTVPWPYGDNAALYASKAEWISPNGLLDRPETSDGRKVVVVDTDHLCGSCGSPEWVWMSFTRGLNLLYMDMYDGGFVPEGIRYDIEDPDYVNIRKNLGYVRQYAQKIDLQDMVPQGELSSSGFALAHIQDPKARYLIFVPNGGRVSVDLRNSAGSFSVEWFDPRLGTVTSGAPAAGGGYRTFAVPFSGSAVLYLSRRE